MQRRELLASKLPSSNGRESSGRVTRRNHHNRDNSPKSLFFFIFSTQNALSLYLSDSLSRACVLCAAREQTKCARCRDRGARSFFLSRRFARPKQEKRIDTLNITLSFFFFFSPRFLRTRKTRARALTNNRITTGRPVFSSSSSSSSSSPLFACIFCSPCFSPRLSVRCVGGESTRRER